MNLFKLLNFKSIAIHLLEQLQEKWKNVNNKIKYLDNNNLLLIQNNLSIVNSILMKYMINLMLIQ